MPSKTPSTKSDRSSKSSGGSGHKRHSPVFVVQKHYASHLHWDFRLELDGVLKSWAVPKEPVSDSAVKRLAVQVEDHDLGYASFEGVIPESQYGAGRVEIWDSGTFDLEHRSKDKLVFHLHGKRLKGRFTILRFPKAGPKDWLLFKTKEEHKL